jgi:arylformamidase
VSISIATPRGFIAMSASEAKHVTLAARSDRSDAPEAVREAMGLILRQLVTAGGAPAHLAHMTWTAADPAAFHPSRRAIDLACREYAGGFQPPVTLRRGGQGLAIEAQALIPPPREGAVWRHFSAAEMAREYNPRLQVPDPAKVFADWRRDGEAFRSTQAALDLTYGSAPSSLLDLYRPTDIAKPPVFVFIHGGFWQVFDKSANAHFTDGLLKAGYAVANLDHELCAPATIAGVVAQVRSALHFLVREADNLGIDGSALHVTGHSAGGHLAAMAAVDSEAPPIRSVVPLSGLFDLEPIAHLPMGRILGLTDASTIARLSPQKLKPRAGMRIGVAVGGAESAEFRRQSRELAQAWGGAFHLAEDRNHFDILDDFRGGALLDFTLKIARGA